MTGQGRKAGTGRETTPPPPRTTLTGPIQRACLSRGLPRPRGRLAAGSTILHRHATRRLARPRKSALLHDLHFLIRKRGWRLALRPRGADAGHVRINAPPAHTAQARLTALRQPLRAACTGVGPARQHHTGGDAKPGPGGSTTGRHQLQARNPTSFWGRQPPPQGERPQRLGELG